jgi:predicted amidohydrolase
MSGSQLERAETLEVALFQLKSVDDVDSNLQSIFKLLKSVEDLPPDLICLPENALFLRLREGTPIPAIAVDELAVRRLSDWSVKFGPVIHVGSVALQRDEKLYNSSLLITPDGGVRDSYQKIHLFDVDVEGHKPVRESDVFAHGSLPSTFAVKGWKFGNTICYDLRFSELFLHYAKQGVDALMIPSAFLVPTGKAHWEVLTRARAIESQAYVLAAAQGGAHRGRDGAVRETWGHSSLIDPWGRVLTVAPDGADQSLVLRGQLSAQVLKSVRAQIPIQNHRRL